MKHLILLVPNNSGSSILHDLISTSRQVAILPNEGQFCDNFIGPIAANYSVAHFFTEKEEIFRNKKNYQWEIIRTSWFKLWEKDNPSATIRLQKSPPDILRTEMIFENFENCKFIMMIRNPYAVVESILRANKNANLVQAANHAIRVLEVQLENSEKYLDHMVMRYEDFTGDIEKYSDKIMKYLEIDDLDWRRIFHTKGYRSIIRNMNEEQIQRLTDDQIRIINKIFKKKIEVLTECGYDLIEIDDFNFKQFTNINVNSWKNKINYFNEEIWNAFSFRQESFEVHEKTNTVPLIFSEDFESENINYRDWFDVFSDEILDISSILANTIGFGYITRAILVKLPAGQTIPEHVDAGESLHDCHRMHIPIITNDFCQFIVGDETVNMKEGEIWEINNTNKIHSVKNLGPEDRIHLIVDWITVDN
jgi:hypothetical protein